MTAEPEGSKRYAAVLFSDIQGYSRMMGKDEAGTLDFLREHDRIFRELIAIHGGRVVKTIGDAFMVEFGGPLPAVRCAVAAQQAFQTRNQRLLKSQRKRVRIGIHAGEVTDRGGDLFGETVNIAARLEGRAPAGGICISAEVQAVAAEPLFKRVRPLGALALKNIGHPVPAWIVWESGMEAAAKRKPSAGLGERALLWSAAAAVLAWGLWALWPGLQRRWEARSWEPLAIGPLVDGKNVGAAWVNETNALSQGRVRLATQGLLYLRQAFPAQPFKVRVRYSNQVGTKPRLRLYVSGWRQGVEEADPWNPSQRVHRLRWSGFYFEEAYDQARHQLLQSVGQQDREGRPTLETLRERPLRAYHGDFIRELTFDQGLLTMDDGGRQRLVAWPGEAGGADLVLGLEGLDMHVQSVEVLVKRRQGDVDLMSVAEEVRLAGDQGLALRLYEQIAARQVDADERDRYLLKRAHLLVQMGRGPEAEAALTALAAQRPLGMAGAQALFESGEAQLWRAQAAAPGKGRDAAYLDALRRFDLLLDLAPHHPSAPRARLLGLTAALALPQQRERARSLAWQMVQDPAGYFKSQASQLLLQAITQGQSDQALVPLLDAYLMDPALGLDLRQRLTAQRYACALRLGDWAKARALAWAAAAPGSDLAGLEGLAAATHEAARQSASVRQGMPIFLQQLLQDRARAWALMRACLREARADQEPHVARLMADLQAGPTQLKDGPAGSRRGRRAWYSAQGSWRISVYGTLQDSLKAEAGPDPDELRFTFDSGQSWGCGFNVWPGVGPFVSEQPNREVDVGAARSLEFDLWTDRPLNFRLKLGEEGVTNTNSVFIPKHGGADGEQYVHAARSLGAGWQHVVVPLTGFTPVLSWGDQLGDDQLDLGGLEVLDMAFSGGQGKAEARLKDLAFVTP